MERCRTEPHRATGGTQSASGDVVYRTNAAMALYLSLSLSQAHVPAHCRVVAIEKDACGKERWIEGYDGGVHACRPGICVGIRARHTRCAL